MFNVQKWLYKIEMNVYISLSKMSITSVFSSLELSLVRLLRATLDFSKLIMFFPYFSLAGKKKYRSLRG